MGTRHIDGIAAKDLTLSCLRRGALASPSKRDSLAGDYAAFALRTPGTGFETANRKEDRRRLGLAARTADSSSLKAFRFMVATLPLW